MPEDYVLYSEILDDSDWILHDIHTPYGTILQAFLGEGSIYLILDVRVDPLTFYPFIRETLHAVRVFLYLPGQGQYEPLTQTFRSYPNEECFFQAMEHCLSQLPACYSFNDLRSIRARLVQLNAQSLGYHKAADGTLYVLRSGVFREASPLDPAQITRLCLYGGFWGLHRFALGKWFTGLLYCMTCGLFLFGWLMDLLQLLLGFARDSRKRLLFPLKDIRSVWKMLPSSLLLGILSMAGYGFLVFLFLQRADILFAYFQRFSFP